MDNKPIIKTDEEIILDALSKIADGGWKPIAIRMSFKIQREIISRMIKNMPEEQANKAKKVAEKNGLITFLGLPVKTKEGGVAVEYE